MYYTVHPPEPWPESGERVPGGQAWVVRLGWWQGVPVDAEVTLLPGTPGRFQLRRLLTTAPELYLWPALQPGAPLSSLG